MKTPSWKLTLQYMPTLAAVSLGLTLAATFGNDCPFYLKLVATFPVLIGVEYFHWYGKKHNL